MTLTKRNIWVQGDLTNEKSKKIHIYAVLTRSIPPVFRASGVPSSTKGERTGSALAKALLEVILVLVPEWLADSQYVKR